MCDEEIENKDAPAEVLKTVSTTLYMCLSYVEGHLDQLYIDHGRFHLNIQRRRLFGDVIKPILSIFELQCKMQKVKLLLRTNLKEDILIEVDQ